MHLLVFCANLRQIGGKRVFDSTLGGLNAALPFVLRLLNKVPLFNDMEVLVGWSVPPPEKEIFSFQDKTAFDLEVIAELVAIDTLEGI